MLYKYLIQFSVDEWSCVPSLLFTWGHTMVAQRVKGLPTMGETWVQSLGWKDPLEKEMATHSSTLSWKIPWTEKRGRLYSPWGHKESDTTKRLHFQTMVEVMKIMAASFERSHHVLLHSVPPALQQATTDPRLRWRLLDTHRQVRVSLLRGHRSFLLGPGAHKVLFVPSKSLFPSPAKFWQLYGGINGDVL